MTLRLNIREGLPAESVPQAARLYWFAFAAKLGRVMGPDDKAIAFFERAIRPDLCLAAFGADGQLVGLAGLRGTAGGFAGGGPDDMRAVYGSFGATWRSAALGALPRDDNANRFLIDGLCVDPDWQSRGIGSQLIAQAEIRAHAQGFGEIQLDVAAENLRARQLYQRLGYGEVSRRATGALRWIFNITATVTMVKPLNGKG